MALAEPGEVVQACDPSTWGAEVGGFLRVQGQPRLDNKTQSQKQTHKKTRLARTHPGKVLAVQAWPAEFNPHNSH